MLDTSITDDFGQGTRSSDLDAKCQRVVVRHQRLRRLRTMHSPEIIVRNEQRMLAAAVDELFEDAEIEAIVSSIGGTSFVDWFNRLAGTDIEPRVPHGSRTYRTPWSDAGAQALGDVA